MKRGAIAGLVVGGVIVAGVIAGVAVALAGGADTDALVAEPSPTAVETGAAEEGPTAAPSAEPSPEPPAAESVSPGAYVDYSEGALADAEGTRVLFFHAPWCPQCRALEESILAEGVPEGVTILKVDYDSNQALRQRYDVRLQTTVVRLDDADGAASVFVAYDEPSLGAALAGLGLPG